MVTKKLQRVIKQNIIEKIEKFEKHLKKLRQQIDNGEVTSENYFTMHKSAFQIDSLIWEYLKDK